MKLSALIINWNRKDDLIYLLNDLSRQSRLADEIIVVDNGSTDGSVEVVRSKFPTVHLILLHKNMGLSFGRNVGIVAATGDLIAILDNDLRILDKQFLSKVCGSAAQHTDCGVISFQQILGVWSLLSKPERSLITLSDLEQIAEHGQAPIPIRCFYDWFFWGGACLIRRTVFDQVGLFDDQFAYGGEEWDFAYRCHRVGIRLLRDTSLWVVHALSPKMRSPVVPDLILKNMIIALSRYLPVSDLIIFLMMQFAKSLSDSFHQKTFLRFIRVWWQVLVSWKSQVMSHRSLLSRAIMNRIYYLRLNQSSSFPEDGQTKVSALDYYRSRAKIHLTKEHDTVAHVLMTR